MTRALIMVTGRALLTMLIVAAVTSLLTIGAI